MEPQQELTHARSEEEDQLERSNKKVCVGDTTHEPSLHDIVMSVVEQRGGKVSHPSLK